MLKAYKYRLYPEGKAKRQIMCNLGCARWVYNWALQRKIETYKQTKKAVSGFALMRELTVLRKMDDTKWLADVDRHSLNKAVQNVESAFTRFFREKKGFPRFHSRKGRQSYKVDTTIHPDFDNNRIKLPKTGWLKCVFSRKFDGEIKHAVVSMEPTSKFFVSILVEDGKQIPVKPKLNREKAIGVDLGLHDFAVLSTGEKIPHPKTLRKHEAKLKHLQRMVSKKVKGSSNRRKAVLKVARAHEKVRNTRKDFLHKLSTRLVRENQAVCMESLSVHNMLKNHKLAKSISDSGWSQFGGFVRYKCEWQGKHFIQIGRFEPSSKMCNKCGHINDALTISDREWVCPKCSEKHDRDTNAARNILSFALQEQNLITPVGYGEEPVERAVVTCL